MDDHEILRTTLTDAVEGIEPGDRLAAIHAATRSAGRRRRHRAWYAVGGSLATAAAATAVVVALVDRPDGGTVIDPAEEPTDAPVTIYYTGPGPDGPQAPTEALYASVERGGSVLELLMRSPSDPDYRTRWPEGSLVSYTVSATSIDVTVAAGAPVDDELAQQQLVFSLQAAEDSRAPVVIDDMVGARFPGVRLERAADLDVLSHMSITEPAEGTTYAAGTVSFTASGAGNSFEAAGGCFLRGTDGRDGFEAGPFPVQMAGWMEPRLFPWELTVDLADVPPGTYTFACTTDDPTGGAEGRGTDTDTRTVIVE